MRRKNNCAAYGALHSQLVHKHLKNNLRTGLLICFTFLFFSCSNKSKGEEQNTGSVKFDQYYVHGELLYTNHCSNCHQPGGTGLGRVYPPLNNSDFMEQNFEKVICMIRHGEKEDITVNGVSFVQDMPPNPTLTDLEIAEIATYIYNTWNHKQGLVEVKAVTKILTTCEGTDP